MARPAPAREQRLAARDEIVFPRSSSPKGGDVLMAEALPSRSRRSSLFAAGIADVLIEIGLDGRIIAASRSATTLTGYETADIEGRAVWDLVHAEDRSRVLRHVVRLRRRGSVTPPTPLELRIQHRMGRWIWVEGNPAPVFDPATGHEIGWVDILRHVEASKVLAHDLLVARRGAEAEAEAQSEFLANMSHEIRTPLNSIIGFMQVLKRDGSLGEVQLGHVRRVEEAGRNLLTVVNDVLDLSKIESGTIRLNERSFSPERLVGDAAALIRPQAVEKGLRLEVEMDPEAATMVTGDPDRLRQILLNLLSNAVKFTLQGEVRLSLAIEAADPMLDLAFTIEDSGVGIAAEQIPKLFRRYTQADGSIARRFGGTGLGLAISKRLVEAMGGSIALDSRLDAGSRFVVRVQLHRSEPQGHAGPHAAATQILAPARGATLHDRRLLVAEDVPINQKLVEAILAPLGSQIDFVADGAQALQAVQAHRYALVLMDMQMPVLDGIETTRAIRALGGRFADLPIIALTANIFPEQVALARTAGMNDFIAKPIDSDHLVATVTKWAAKSQPLG